MMIARDCRFGLGWLGRLTLALFIVTTTAVSAYADPQLVRVIWDVGKGMTYYRAEPMTFQGQDTFTVPAGVMEAINQKFVLTTGAFLRKGDRVRIYVVNYNGVSHVWHDSSVMEQVAEGPSLVGPLLNALTLAITGVGKLPIAGISSFNLTSRTDLSLPPSSPCQFPEITKALETLQDKAKSLGQAADDLVALAKKPDLALASRKLAAVPTNGELWRIFDNQAAWDALIAMMKRDGVFTTDFDTDFKPLAEDIKEMQGPVDAVNAAQVAFDQRVALYPPFPRLTEECRERLRELVAMRDNALTYVREVAGDGSASREVITRYQSASTMWSLYKRKLLESRWNHDAIEFVLKEPVKAESVLRIDAVFASTDKNVQERIQRNVVLGVEPYVPRLVISSGIAGHGFKFRKLEVVKTTVTAADETVSAKNILRTTEDTTWQRLVPVWLQHIRLGQSGDWGTYATFGTTPDRNIFRNGILGVSAYRPRWRTVVSVGALFARGYEQKHLEPVIEDFSDATGLALADVSSTNVPLPDMKWRKSLFVSVSFGLVSF